MNLLISELAQQIILVCAALTAAGVIAAVVFRKIRSIWRWGKRIGEYVEVIKDIAETELTQNGGDSMRDNVKLIKPNHAYAIGQFESLGRADREHAETLEELRTRFEVVERQQKFFRALIDAVLLTLPAERQDEFRKLSDRVLKAMDGAA